MKILKNVLAVVIALIVILNFNSCNDNDEITSQSNFDLASQKLLKEGKFTPTISAKDVGNYHNKYLLEAVNYTMDKNVSNKSTIEYSSALNQLDYGLSEGEKKALNEALINTTEEERLEFLKNNLSPIVFNILIELEEVIEKNPNDYNKVSVGLDEVLNSSNLEQFNEVNAYLIKGYAETLRSSAYFWYPTHSAGSATGSKYKSFVNKKISTSSKRLPGWARADGRGFGWGLVWGTITTANPASGFLAGIGGAIGGSLMHR